jgi:hypothetical protein
VVRADLERSGLFKLVELGPSPMGADAPPDFGRVRSRGADAFAVGTVAPSGSGRYQVQFRLFDAAKQVSLGSQAMVMAPNQYRTTGHRIADFIYEKLTGEPGVFSTRIAYVLKSGPRYELQIADADGSNAQTALASKEPIISPAWSPDGSRLAYVSFEAKKPVVYVHSLATGQRNVAANFKGSNSAPAWSPDGRRLAVVLTKDGQSQLYSVNADGSGVQRLASSSGIDTEPAWSTDGMDLLHLRSGRQPADLPRTGRWRRRPAGQLRRHLQRQPAPVARRQEPCLRLPQRRPLPGHPARPEFPPDPDPHRLGQGRIPQLRPQRPHGALRHRSRRPRRAGRRVVRRSCQAASVGTIRRRARTRLGSAAAQLTHL